MASSFSQIQRPVIVVRKFLRQKVFSLKSLGQKEKIMGSEGSLFEKSTERRPRYCGLYCNHWLGGGVRSYMDG